MNSCAFPGARLSVSFCAPLPIPKQPVLPLSQRSPRVGLRVLLPPRSPRCALPPPSDEAASPAKMPGSGSGSGSASPLLPVSAAPSAQPPRRRRSRSTLVSKLLLGPARAALGGSAFLAAAALSSHLGLSRRATVAAALGALGASQAILFACGVAQRRSRRRHAAESQKVAAISNLMAWNEAVGAVRKIVDTFADGLAAPFTLKHLLLDAELLRRHHTALYDAQVAREWQPSDEKALIAGRRFARFAMSSYGFAMLKLMGLIGEGHDVFVHGTAPVDVVMHQLKIGMEDILVLGLVGDVLGVPRHFVARDPSTKSIVVIVRGTNSLSDVLVDLLCDSAPFGKGYAHKGMRDAAQALYAAVAPTLRKALAENRGYTVVVAGHSLGAGVAMLLTKVLLDNGFKGTKCYAVSPPPVFGPKHAIDSQWSKSLECFVRCDDIVPCLSLASARALVMEIERIDALPLSDSTLRGLSPENLRVAITGSRDSARRSDNTKPESSVAPLFIPTSHVHWMIPRRDSDDSVDGGDMSSFVSVRAEASAFSRMLITRNCVTSHFPNSYDSAFNNLPIPPDVPQGKKKSPPPSQKYPYDGELGF